MERGARTAQTTRVLETQRAVREALRLRLGARLPNIMVISAEQQLIYRCASARVMTFSTSANDFLIAMHRRPAVLAVE